MKIIFFGSDDFAVVQLEKLINSKHQVLACVTQPDKPQGRHLDIGVSPVKEFAAARKIPVLQPKTLKDGNSTALLKDFNADVFIVVAYGQILPSSILSLPKIFSLNIHGSLLPKYRGAAPINWAIINGDKLTGVTLIKMNEKMDAGEIISAEEMKIDEADTSVTLRLKMAKLAAALLLKTLDSIENKTYKLKKQDESAVILAPKLTKDLGFINWKKNPESVYNLIRGLLPWPGAYTYYCGKRLKILEAKPLTLEAGKFSGGEVVALGKDGFDVVAGKGIVRIAQVHLESSKPMSAKDFMAGHNLGIGFRFE